jgi:hypothetical protein
MARCFVCGNDYDKCKIVGHGAEKDGTFYCCAHCAAQEGVTGLDDRV